MRIFFYDTETSGLPLFREPSEDPRQPHVVQFAAALVDSETRRTIASIDLIARPDGWTIPEEVSAIHGITTERASDVGVPESEILAMAVALWQRADTRVAHNEEFDARICRIGLKRFPRLIDSEVWKQGPAECTAAMSTPICKMPPTEKMRRAGFNNYKKPKLSEAHKILLGYDLENAHSALADVDGCQRIYWHMVDAVKAVAA